MNNQHRGFTLIEVLVALVILAVGLLGMATLMMGSMQSSQGAYMRSQASVLAYDIVERMRSNRAEAITTDNYELTADATATSNPGCDSTGCTASQQAQLDLREWRAAVEAGIPSATTVITRDHENEYAITISWAETGSVLKNQDDSTVSPSFSLRVNL